MKEHMHWQQQAIGDYKGGPLTFILHFNHWLDNNNKFRIAIWNSL